MKLLPGMSWVYRIFGLQPATLHPRERMLLAVALFCSVAAFVITLRDVQFYAGVDLRGRVVGARLMLAGHDPYFFDWQPEMPLEWLDPVYSVVPDLRLRHMTASPPMLWLHTPLARMHYKGQRILFCVLEWFALTVSVALLCRLIPTQSDRVLFLLGTVLFFVFAPFWRFHVERGQVYSFYLLALSLGTFWALRDDRSFWRAGVAFGIATLMRFNYGILAPAFFLAGRWRLALAFTLTVVLGALATVPFTPTGSWSSCFKVMDQYYVEWWSHESLDPIPRPQYEGTIVEGYDFRQYIPGFGYPANFAFVYSKMCVWFGLPVLDVGLVSKLLMGALAILMLGLVWFGSRDRPNPRLVMLLVLTLTLDLDYFAPSRTDYADIMLLLPLALSLPFLREVRQDSQLAASAVLIGLIAGMCLCGSEQGWGSPLRNWLVMGGISALVLWRWKGVQICAIQEPRTLDQPGPFIEGR